MVLVHGDIQASPPLAVALAVLAEHQPVGVRLLVFVPEQCQRDVLSLQFPVDVLGIGCRTIYIADVRLGIEHVFQGCIVQPLWQRPGDAGSFSSL